MRKVNLEVLKPWIATRITELLGGVEDEVLIGALWRALPARSVRAACARCAARALRRARAPLPAV